MTAAVDVSSLSNRIQKNARHLARWARREAIQAWRVYDRDIPEFPYAVDRYGDWLHVQLFDGKRELEDREIATHLQTISDALAVAPAHLVLKVRRRQRGLSQYEKLGEHSPSFVVSERGRSFEVNLGRYLDTGLFLDHRDTRQLFGQHADGKRVLNLFAYTGSFTVYAALGGAMSTLTVDLSRTYQDWTRRNLVLNGIADNQRHLLVAADVLVWLEQAAAMRDRFDLIMLDPPSFSNSKRMHESFDVQRDHGRLLRNTMALLAPGGSLYFSTNRQGFRLDATLEAQWAIEEISHRTVPEDFKRARPHRCWMIELRA